MNRPRLPLLVTLGCLALAALGLPGMLHRLGTATVADGSERLPWGLWTVAYTFFSGIASGAFAVVALSRVFGYRRFRPLAPFALLAALVALSTSLLFVLVDYGRPIRTLQFLFRLDLRSTTGWLLALHGFYGALLAAMLWLSLRPAFARMAARGGALVPRVLALGFGRTEASVYRNERALRVLAMLGFACSLSLSGGVGNLFSVVAERTFWHPGLFPITFLVSAMLSGVAFVLGGATLLGTGGRAFRDTLVLLGRLLGYLLVAQVLGLVAEVAIVLNSEIPAQVNVVHAVVYGPYPWVFWGVQLGIGVVAAFLLVFFPRRVSLASTSIAALFVLAGVCALRLNFVFPELALRDGAVSLAPTTPEWSLVFTGVGFSGLAMLVGRVLLPVFPADAAADFDAAARASRGSWAPPLSPLPL